MSELNRMAQPLLEQPLFVAPSIADLRLKNKVRRRQHVAAGGAGTVLAVVVVVIVVALVPSTPRPGSEVPGSTKLAAYIQTGVSVPDSTLEAVGLPAEVTPPSLLHDQQPLGDQAKPVIVYVGGEFCPYCAMQRWALVVALSRFGTFSNLGQIISSSSSDVFPGLQSWSFERSTYTSHDVTFDPAEIFSSRPTGDGYEPLQRLDPTQKRAYDTLDDGTLPFLDIGNKYAAIGSSADPVVLSGLSLNQIASDLSDPTNPVAQAVDGSANYLIASICEAAPRSGAPICSAPYISRAQSRMATQSFNPSP